MSSFPYEYDEGTDDPEYGRYLSELRNMHNMFMPMPVMGDLSGVLASMLNFELSLMPPMNMNPMAMNPMGANPMALNPMAMNPMAMNPMAAGGMFNSPFLGGGGNSFSSSTVYMSNGPDGRPQVYSSTSSTQVGPGGVKETRQTVQDSRTGTKKMSIGHHINERAHVIEREQNVRSGDLEERQEFINIEEEEADDFNREFQQRLNSSAQPRNRLGGATAPLLALPAPSTSSRRSTPGPTPRRGLRSPVSGHLSPSSAPSRVRQTYGSVQPQRAKQRGSRHHENNTPDY